MRDTVGIAMKTEKPWGSYEVIFSTMSAWLKKLVVNPGCRLSLQKHYHRNELWMIAEGSGRVTKNGKEFVVVVGNSVFVRVEDVHRMECTSDVPLVFYEYAFGDLVDENDIVRISDDYSR
jgi:mannose-6-phosphate isomerase-like protein (cupin superfamily)